METNLMTSKRNSPKKKMGKFNTLKEAVAHKTGLVNQLLAKIDKQQLDALAK
ncbi:hypothetical protein GVN20_12385 [Runella sp. CRIBMP]|uniref:Uncharacterized protein n=1 Tax=Runella salmonicolor TaxID=2950278 RepID=A0ABT1FRA8_9BACT|nr:MULTISPECIES: hypothetical protein [Runella]MCP1383308.1 hypothetical protein [Runella salmonicolor]NBB20153.1 hypothetical protein [Runella sp. CRIBMP]